MLRKLRLQSHSRAFFAGMPVSDGGVPAAIESVVNKAAEDLLRRLPVSPTLPATKYSTLNALLLLTSIKAIPEEVADC